MTNRTYQPLPDSLHIGESKIHGQGLVASENIPMGTDLGISHYRKGDDVIRTPLGGFINHTLKYYFGLFYDLENYCELIKGFYVTNPPFSVQFINKTVNKIKDTFEKNNNTIMGYFR